MGLFDETRAHLDARIHHQRRWQAHLEKLAHTAFVFVLLRAATIRFVGTSEWHLIAFKIALFAWLGYLVAGKVVWYTYERPRRVARGETHVAGGWRAAKDVVGDAVIGAGVPILVAIAEHDYAISALLTWLACYYFTQRARWTSP